MPSKLVRDKVPDLMRAEGLDPTVVQAFHLIAHLPAKVREELAELEAAPDRAAVLEEFADLREAVDALGRALGLRPFEVAQAQFAKREAKGGFDGGILLEVPNAG